MEMVCVPSVNAEVLKVAYPELLRVPVPRVVAPSLKVRVPVGAPVAGMATLTVPVKVTTWPTTDGFTEDEATVMVAPLLIV
jgi:hypothetical protein